MSIICNILGLYAVAVFARIILSWFPTREGTVLATVSSALYTITEPVLGPLRRVMPGVGGGGFRIDFSPMVVIIGITILRNIIGCGSFLIF